MKRISFLVCMVLERLLQEIPNVHGKRSPSKMVGGAKSGPRDHTETEEELCLSVFCGGTGQLWTAARTWAVGVVDLGIA